MYSVNKAITCQNGDKLLNFCLITMSDITESQIEPKNP